MEQWRLQLKQSLDGVMKDFIDQRIYKSLEGTTKGQFLPCESQEILHLARKGDIRGAISFEVGLYFTFETYVEIIIAMPP